MEYRLKISQTVSGKLFYLVQPIGQGVPVDVQFFQHFRLPPQVGHPALQGSQKFRMMLRVVRAEDTHRRMKEIPLRHIYRPG